jgi:hypothetical protein
MSIYINQGIDCEQGFTSSEIKIYVPRMCFSELELEKEKEKEK